MVQKCGPPRLLLVLPVQEIVTFRRDAGMIKLVEWSWAAKDSSRIQGSQTPFP